MKALDVLGVNLARRLNELQVPPPSPNNQDLCRQFTAFVRGERCMIVVDHPDDIDITFEPPLSPDWFR